MEPGSLSVRQPFAVLLAAYGSPRDAGEVPAYLQDVRGGRSTPPALVQELTQRYAAIGGRSPLLERTRDQARALAEAVNHGTPVFVGMRHWHPYIADVMREIQESGHERVVAVPLAPHYSRLSIGAYATAIESARGAAEVRLVEPWFEHPGFLDAVADLVHRALQRFPGEDRGQVTLLFTAHSLPERILADGDPYPDQLRASVAGVMSRLGRTEFRIAYQSAGRTDERWLGPEAGDTLRELAAHGVRNVLLCPIGFVSDHLEVLYDVDIELQQLARSLDLRLERADSLNQHPRFIAALAEQVERAARNAGWS
jgi:ferrochelatase